MISENKKLTGISKYFSIKEYYEKVIIPIDRKRFRVASGDKMICPLHNDHDPSLGIIINKGKETYHCFGCNAWGDIVDLHLRISKKYFKKYLNREESLKELCKIFNVDETEIIGIDKTKENLDEKRDGLIEENQGKFDLTDYKYLVLNGKLQKRSIGYFNALMMSMIWALKQVEE